MRRYCFAVQVERIRVFEEEEVHEKYPVLGNEVLAIRNGLKLSDVQTTILLDNPLITAASLTL